jgi:hypothetical protein
MLATIATWAVFLGCLAIGIGFDIILRMLCSYYTLVSTHTYCISATVAPKMASAHFGIVLKDPRALAFVRAMGIRDLVMGLMLGMRV